MFLYWFCARGHCDMSGVNQKNVRNPKHHYFSKKYRNIPPICIAVRLQFVSQYFWCPDALTKGKCQYSSHLYRSTPPICIAIRQPFVSQYFWGKSWWLWSPGCSPVKDFKYSLLLSELSIERVCERVHKIGDFQQDTKEYLKS